MNQADWLWGWDPTPGIVSVWAEGDGRVHVWRRVGGNLVHEEQGFRPWLLVDRIDGLDARVTTRELAGEGALRFVVRADTMATLTSAVVQAAARCLRVLRDNFATRLARAFAPDDYAAVFADPDQLTLFSPS